MGKQNAPLWWLTPCVSVVVCACKYTEKACCPLFGRAMWSKSQAARSKTSGPVRSCSPGVMAAFSCIASSPPASRTAFYCAAIPWLARLLGVAVAFVESDLDIKGATALISQGSGSSFDPEAVRVFLRAVPKAVVPGKQREVMLSELTPGMVLAQGIYSENGVLLIPDGQRLTSTYIDKLNNYNRINPISQSLLVYC